MVQVWGMDTGRVCGNVEVVEREKWEVSGETGSTRSLCLFLQMVPASGQLKLRVHMLPASFQSSLTSC